jgi:hypothetical protein
MNTLLIVGSFASIAFVVAALWLCVLHRADHT